MNNRASDENDRLRLLARLLTEAPDQDACERCLDGLEDYVDAQLAGRDYTGLLPDVARHLDACVACAQSYALLYEGRLVELHGSVAPPAPAPDLSFLSPPPAAAGLFAEALSAALRRSADGLHLTFARALSGGPPSARPAAGASVRGASDAALLELDLPAPDPAVARLTVAVYADASPEQCIVRVQVALPGREWPDLEGLAVELRLGAERRREQTDAWGAVDFAGVPRAALGQVELVVALGSAA